MNNYVNVDILKANIAYNYQIYTFDYETAVLEAFDDTPIEDVELIRHGHWIRMAAPTWEGHHWCCSECGGHIITKYPDYPEDKYCKHCGAKMDEEAEDVEKAEKANNS